MIVWSWRGRLAASFPAVGFLQRLYVTNTWHGGCGDRGSVRRACRSTMSSSQNDCNISWWRVYVCVCVCNKSVGFSTRWLAAERFYSSVASFLLVSWPSKIGYLLSTSAQLSEPLAKSRTITGNSLTWWPGIKTKPKILSKVEVKCI